MLSFFVTAGVIVGFDASGHVAEETKNASLVAARGVFYSALASGLMGFPMVILFLFCTPNFDTLFGFDSPQPFVNLYALALGQNVQIIMNLVAIFGLVLVHTPHRIQLTSEYLSCRHRGFQISFRHRPRWRPSFFWLDLPSFLRRSTPQRRQNNLGCQRRPPLHHSPVPRRFYISRQRRRSPVHHCLRSYCLCPFLHYPREILPCQMEFGEVESSLFGDYFRVEFVCFWGVVFAALFPGDGGYV